MTSREVFMTATIDDQWRNSAFRFPRKQNRQVCWTSLQSDQNLRAPHIATQQRLSIDICLPRPTAAANTPTAAAAIDRWDRQTDAQTLPFYDACRRPPTEVSPRKSPRWSDANTTNSPSSVKFTIPPWLPSRN